MITKKQYVEYLVSTPKNCTCTYLAEHLEGVSHDVVTDFLRQKRCLPREVWKLVKDRIEDRKEACRIVDDSVHDKRYSRSIELVRAQYSGNEHRVVKGMGVVSLVHSAGTGHPFYPIDYRVYAPDLDGKTKNTHFQEMFVHALDQKHIRARTLLFDGWYASAENLKLIHHRKRTFFTTLKSNRLVSLSKEQGYVHLEEVEWTPARVTQGVLVKLKEVPFQVRLFKLVAPDGDIDWVIPNDLAETVTAQVAEDSSDVRWQVEELHRGLKQLTGSEKCQCRGARAQRNHLACC
jgi:DDE superfamily endonuclease